jgi:hypothetical protein
MAAPIRPAEPLGLGGRREPTGRSAPSPTSWAWASRPSSATSARRRAHRAAARSSRAFFAPRAPYGSGRQPPEPRSSRRSARGTRSTVVRHTRRTGVVEPARTAPGYASGRAGPARAASSHNSDRGTKRCSPRACRCNDTAPGRATKSSGPSSTGRPSTTARHLATRTSATPAIARGGQIPRPRRRTSVAGAQPWRRPGSTPVGPGRVWAAPLETGHEALRLLGNVSRPMATRL